MLNEEPYALVAHVRFCGGVKGVSPWSTQDDSQRRSRHIPHGQVIQPCKGACVYFFESVHRIVFKEIRLDRNRLKDTFFEKASFKLDLRRGWISGIF